MKKNPWRFMLIPVCFLGCAWAVHHLLGWYEDWQKLQERLRQEATGATQQVSAGATQAPAPMAASAAPAGMPAGAENLPPTTPTSAGHAPEPGNGNSASAAPAGGGPQGMGGGFDPSMFRQMAMQRIRQRLACSEEQWTGIEAAIDRIRVLRSSVEQRRRQGGGDSEGDPALKNLNELLAKEEIDSEALANAVQALRERRKAVEAEIEKEQENLKGQMDLRQQTVLVLEGYLK